MISIFEIESEDGHRKTLDSVGAARLELRIFVVLVLSVCEDGEQTQRRVSASFSARTTNATGSQNDRIAERHKGENNAR